MLCFTMVSFSVWDGLLIVALSHIGTQNRFYKTTG